MTTERKLQKIAANLDDMSETLEEIRIETEESGAPEAAKLDEINQHMERAADAIEDAVDPE
jgi:hypothetical protein